MAEFIEIINKDPNIQNEISQTIDKYNKKSLSTRSHLVQKASIQSRVFQQAINTRDDKISDIDIELEQKDDKLQFSEDKIGIPDSKVIEELNGLDLN